MNLGQLEELTLDHNAITELPNSVRHLTALKVCPSFLDCLFVRVFMLLRDGEVLRGEPAALSPWSGALARHGERAM